MISCGKCLLCIVKRFKLNRKIADSDDEDEDSPQDDPQLDMDELHCLSLPDLSPRLEENDEFEMHQKFINLSMRRYSMIQEDIRNLL